jgi:hypothetical protein
VILVTIPPNVDERAVARAEEWRRLAGSPSTKAMQGAEALYRNNLMGARGEWAVALYHRVPLLEYPGKPGNQIDDYGDLLLGGRTVDVKTTRGRFLRVKLLDRNRISQIDGLYLVRERSEEHRDFELHGYISTKDFFAQAELNRNIPQPAYELPADQLQDPEALACVLSQLSSIPATLPVSPF